MNGSIGHGAFQCAQFADGHVLCQVTLEEPVDSEMIQTFTRLVGTTNEGHSIEAKHLQFTRASWKISSEYVATFLARELHVRSLQSMPVVHARFAITNFDFYGVGLYTEPLPNGRVRGEPQLRWTLDGREVIVRRTKDYEDVLRMIKATRGIDVTAIAWVSPVTSPKIDDDAIQLMDDVCMLLSLARGCRIQWLYWDALSEDGRIVSSYHRDAITRPYSPLRLIPSKPPEDTHYLVESCFDSYRQQKQRWGLEHAIASYVDAKSEFDYLESRGLKMVVVMEFLRGHYLALVGKQHIIDEHIFENGVKELKKQVKKILRMVFPSMEDKEVQIMANHVQGMNWYPFRRSLREMFAYLGLDISPKELQRFVDTRNKLVHEARFATNDPWTEYSMITTLVGKALLGILNYDGYYYDWAKFADHGGPPVRVKMEYTHEGGK